MFCGLAGMAVGSAVTALAMRQQTMNKRDEAATPSIRTRDDTSISTQDGKKEPRRDLIVCIVKQLWPYLNPAICNAIRATVEPMLRDLPGPLTTLRFTEFDLGIENFVLGQATVHDLNNGFLQFDMDVNYVSNRRISLKASYVGSVGVDRIELVGRIAVVLKPLTKVLPCVSAVQLFFIDPPKLQMNFTGLAEIADIQLIKSKILAGIGTALKNVVVAPYSYVAAKVDPDCDYFNVYRPPISVLRVTLLSGEGFVDAPRILGRDDVPDVFCKIALGASDPLRSRTVWNNNSPLWDRDEFFDFLLYDYGQSIFLQAWDESNGALDSDDDLGKAEITVRELLLAAKNRTVKLSLIGKNGSPTGSKISIRCDLIPLAKDVSSLISQTPSSETMGGLITILIDHAFSVPLEAMEEMHVTSKVRVQYGDKKFETLLLPGTNPHYNTAFHVPISTKAFSQGGGKDITLTLYKCYQENLLKAPEETLLGEIKLPYSALERAADITINETHPVGSGGTALRYRVSLHGIDLKTSNPTSAVLSSGSAIEGKVVKTSEAGMVSDAARATVNSTTAGNTTTTKDKSDKNADILKLTAVQGRNFKYRKHLLQESHMSNAYLKIQVGSNPNNTWRTKTCYKSKNPIWNETSAFVLSGPNETIQIDAYDNEEGRTYRDDKLGSAELKVEDVLLTGGKKEVELISKDKPTGTFVTIQCEKVAA
ncbi:hypothetical protein FisN_7Lh245 [Fistulifera solaris]|uniref:C2 domain-containing protein n=1 Tax=Fistulifera solaris TaxID=1519565 RepID=A0A1Z5JRP1_FISSO|nr:hypothetical protein FisN_7Lh245 [Fistulifera solaris]|eukprot:GAX16522.1 hypothetical protein FisN_7Lh245 [Fistulifera solaris]